MWRLTVILLLIVDGVGFICDVMLDAVLPLFLRSPAVDASPLMVGIARSSCSLAQVVAAGGNGLLADRVGRKHFLMAICSIVGILSMALSVCRSVSVLLCLLVLVALVSSKDPVVTPYVLCEAGDDSARTEVITFEVRMGLIYAVVGTILGTTLYGHSGWVAVCLCMSGASALQVVLCSICGESAAEQQPPEQQVPLQQEREQPEHRTDEKQEEPTPSFRQLIANRNVGPALLYMSLFQFAGNLSMSSLQYIVTDRYQYSETDFGNLMSALMVTTLIFSQFSGYIIAAVPQRTILALTVILPAMALSWIAFATAFTWSPYMVLGTTLVATTMSVSMMATLSKLKPASTFSRVLGLQVMIGGLCKVLAHPTSASLYVFRWQAPLLVSCALNIGALATVALIPGPEPAPESAATTPAPAEGKLSKEGEEVYRPRLSVAAHEGKLSKEGAEVHRPRLSMAAHEATTTTEMRRRSVQPLDCD